MKRFRWIALFAVLMLVAAACGDSADDTTAAPSTTAAPGDGSTTAAPGPALEGTLKVLLHQNPPLVEYMNDFNSRFMAANPGLDIQMEIVESGDIATGIQTRLTANEVDVIDYCPAGCSAFSTPVQPYMSNVEPPLWQQLIEAGLIADLSGESFVANYDPIAVADAGTYNGGVYAIPAARVSYSGMFVNNDLLADVGISIPTTWGELVA